MGVFQRLFSPVSSSGVGIDLGSSTMKAAQIVKVFDKRKVSRFGICPTPKGSIEGGVIVNPEAVASELKNLLHSANISEKSVTTTVSGPSVILRTITMGHISKLELKQAIRYEAEHYIPYPVSDAQVDGVILRNSIPGEEQNMEVLLMAAPKTTVKGIEDVINLTDLELKAIEHDSISLHRILPFVLNAENLKQTVAVVHMGAAYTNAHIYHEGSLRGSRTIPIAGNQLTQAISQTMNVGLEEAEIMKKEKGEIRIESGSTPVPLEVMQIFQAVLPSLAELITELQRFFDFYRSRCKGESVDRIYLSGGSACIKNLDLYFSETFGLPAEIFPAWEKLGGRGISNHPLESAEESGIVLGLSAWFL